MSDTFIAIGNHPYINAMTEGGRRRIETLSWKRRDADARVVNKFDASGSTFHVSQVPQGDHSPVPAPKRVLGRLCVNLDWLLSSANNFLATGVFLCASLPHAVIGYKDDESFDAGMLGGNTRTLSIAATTGTCQLQSTACRLDTGHSPSPGHGALSSSRDPFSSQAPSKAFPPPLALMPDMLRL
ncbi:hypothetical protein MMC19_001522 [Ptychographa xylographoides]|nr:hypothetical protein [Ptychographa xylographoides]